MRLGRLSLEVWKCNLKSRQFRDIDGAELLSTVKEHLWLGGWQRVFALGRERAKQGTWCGLFTHCRQIHAQQL